MAPDPEKTQTSFSTDRKQCLFLETQSTSLQFQIQAVIAPEKLSLPVVTLRLTGPALASDMLTFVKLCSQLAYLPEQCPSTLAATRKKFVSHFSSRRFGCKSVFFSYTAMHSK